MARRRKVLRAAMDESAGLGTVACPRVPGDRHRRRSGPSRRQLRQRRAGAGKRSAAGRLAGRAANASSAISGGGRGQRWGDRRARSRYRAVERRAGVGAARRASSSRTPRSAIAASCSARRRRSPPRWRDPVSGLTMRQLHARLTRPRPLPR